MAGYQKGILVENRNFFISLAFDAPVGGSSGSIAIQFGMQKLEWFSGGATRWWKNLEDMYNRLDRIAYRRVTDRRTDILPQHDLRYAYVSSR